MDCDDSTTIKRTSSNSVGMSSKSQWVEAISLIATVNSPALAKVQLSDLVCITTLGTGNFGRVELVRIGNDFTHQTFALKKMKKTVVSYVPAL